MNNSTTDNNKDLKEVKVNDIAIVDERTNNYLTDVKSANLLSDENLQKLRDLAPELQHNFQTQTIWRTETEIGCSVLNDMFFPDNASKYHQAKLEQSVFAEQLLYLSLDYDDLRSDIEIVDADIEELQFKLSDVTLKPFQIKKLQAQLNKKHNKRKKLIYGFENMKIQGRERMREVEIWSKIKNELDDGSFDKDSKDQNQLVSMTRKYIMEAWNAINMGANSDIASYNNIVAQFTTLVKTSYLRGILDEVLSYFEESKRTWVKQVCGIPTDNTFK